MSPLLSSTSCIGAISAAVRCRLAQASAFFRKLPPVAAGGLLLVALPAPTLLAEITPVDFRLEHLAAPQGIDEPKPRFSWKLQSDEPAQQQTAYQIRVYKRNGSAATPQAPTLQWDSGVVKSASQFVEYAGKPLEPKSRYFWTLAVFDKDGKKTATERRQRGSARRFSTGIFGSAQWEGKWIGLEKQRTNMEKALPNTIPIPARYLHKEFKHRETPVRATAYIAGVGYYELSINGKKIGDHELDPIAKDYDKTVPYVTHELDPKIFDKSDAKNDIEIKLGSGHFFQFKKKLTTRNFGFPKARFQLELQYKNGETQTIVSDETWDISTDGAIQENSNWDGEIFDASKKKINYAHKAEIVKAPAGKLRAQMIPPMRVVETFNPLSVKKLRDGVWIYDFGVNLVGSCALQIPVGLPSGTKIQLRHAETLKKDGSLYTANLRSAKSLNIYIASGEEKTGDTYAPTFTFHGFRYVELTLPANITATKDLLLARAINTDLQTIGKFKTSNETINAIFRNIHRGLQGNYLSMPTDCPQRDERQGWQGDRAGEAKGEMMVFDSGALYSKWMDDIEDSQLADGNLSDVCPNYYQFYGPNVTWPTAFTLIPGTIYTMYGDKRPIEKHYAAMKRWLIDCMGRFVKDGLISKDNYGDWCVPPEHLNMVLSRDPKRKTSREVIATTYYIYNLELLAKYATMLGKTEDVKLYTEQAAKMRKAFNDKYIKEIDGRVQIDNGTQTSCILPLYFNIVPKDKRARLFDTLVNNIENVTNNHIGTGLIGGQWLNQTLHEFGRDDIALKFTTHKDYPSWGYMVEQGATTIWELWNGNTANPSMNSGNHVMLIGDLVIWYYEVLAGIKADPEKPGFEHIIMKPTPVPGLDFVNAEVNTIKGIVKSSWKNQDGKFSWNIEIPVGAIATVCLPDGSVIKDVPAGKHSYTCAAKKTPLQVFQIKRDFISLLSQDAEASVTLPFVSLPAGAVEPQGWIKDWANSAAQGITGHLDEWSPTYGKSWKGVGFRALGADPKTGMGWPLEQGAYWLDGAVRLAYILNDPALKEKVTARLDKVVDGVLNGGESFIYWRKVDFADPKLHFESWAHSHIGRALVAYYEATGNPRILEALKKVYGNFPVTPVPTDNAGNVSGTTNADPMLSTYLLSGAPEIQQALSKMSATEQTKKTVKEWNAGNYVNGHGVIVYENLRIPALLALMNDNPDYLKATEKHLDWLDKHHTLPHGIASSEEFLAGRGAARLTETCNVAAAAWTYQQLYAITANGKYGDRIEQIFFNAAPAPVACDYGTMSYYQSPNRIEKLVPADFPKAPGGERSIKLSKLGHEVLCCVGNVNRALPNYIMNMWQGTEDKGIAATLYGPSVVRAIVGRDVPIKITSTTEYPFGEEILLTIMPEKTVFFPLYLRIPDWCKTPVVKLNGEFVNTNENRNGLIRIKRQWKAGDKVSLHFPMSAKIVDGQETPYPKIPYFTPTRKSGRAAAKEADISSPFRTVYYGPLLFALPIKEESFKNQNKQLAGEKWNYALTTKDAKSIQVSREKMPAVWQWRSDIAPIKLSVKAATFDWKPTPEFPLPKKPVQIENGKEENIVLIPYGCTKFRISMFPVTSTEK